METHPGRRGIRRWWLRPTRPGAVALLPAAEFDDVLACRRSMPCRAGAESKGVETCKADQHRSRSRKKTVAYLPPCISAADNQGVQALRRAGQCDKGLLATSAQRCSRIAINSGNNPFRQSAFCVLPPNSNRGKTKAFATGEAPCSSSSVCNVVDGVGRSCRPPCLAGGLFLLPALSLARSITAGTAAAMRLLCHPASCRSPRRTCAYFQVTNHGYFRQQAPCEA